MTMKRVEDYPLGEILSVCVGMYVGVTMCRMRLKELGIRSKDLKTPFCPYSPCREYRRVISGK